DGRRARDRERPAGGDSPGPARDRRLSRQGRGRRGARAVTVASANGTMLSTDGVVAGYVPEVNILNGVSMDVREGEIGTVVGPNGAGKSTLIKTIFGLLTPREGNVQLRGENIGGHKPHTITRKGMSYVPQLDNVFPSLTVDENLQLGSLDRARTDERISRM